MPRLAAIALVAALVTAGAAAGDERAGRVAQVRRETDAAIAALSVSSHAEHRRTVGRLEAVVAAWRRLDEPGELARALVALIHAAEATGNPDRALAAGREARDIAATRGDRRTEGEAESGVGHVLWLLGRPAEALEHQQRALALFTALGDRQEQRDARLKIGLALQSLGRRQEAAAAFERLAAELRADPEAPARQAALVLYSLGTARRDEGDIAAAHAAFAESARRAEAAGHLAHQARSLAARGEMEALLDRRTEARATLEGAVGLWRRHGDPEGTALALAQLSLLEQQDGALAAAERNLDETLAILESARRGVADTDLRTSYFGLRQIFFARHVDLLVERHRVEPGAGHDRRAFRASEQARARALLDLLTTARGDVRAAGVDRLTTVDELQARALDDRTLLLSFFLGVERAYLFLVWRDGFRLVPLPAPRGELERRVRAIAELLAHSDNRLARVPAATATSELSTALLGEAPEIARFPRLVFVPDGELTRLPFAALDEPAAPDAEPLVARHEIALLPSASTLVALLARPRVEGSARHGVAVFADPVFGPGDPRLDASGPAPAGEPPLARLPGTRSEADAILRLAADRRPLAAIGFDAERELALAPAVAESAILHFATHAVVDEERPERTALVLSRRDRNGRPIDGLLRLPDLAHARLRADLVVLSGCSTRRGFLMPGEGLLGLVRGFLDAGASRVVASLWPVRDEATARFFETFYADLLRDGTSPAAALRAAQQAMRSDPRYGAPHFWAGFVLEGDPR